MVQFPSINFFFLGILQFLLGFSKVPVFFVSPVCITTTNSVQSKYFISTNVLIIYLISHFKLHVKTI